jgi:hypothetical protein
MELLISLYLYTEVESDHFSFSTYGHSSEAAVAAAHGK